MMGALLAKPVSLLCISIALGCLVFGSLSS
jgi:hypothetical protein